MKIKSIDSSHTDKTQTAFKTDPPLTEEVIECAINDIFGPQWRERYFEEDGLFIVRRTLIPKEQIPEYERSLTNAENLVRRRKESAKKNRDDLLDDISDRTGLPVE